MTVQELTQQLISMMHTVDILAAGVMGGCNKETLAIELKNVANALGRTAQAINPDEEPDKELEQHLKTVKLTGYYLASAITQRISECSPQQKGDIYMQLVDIFSHALWGLDSTPPPEQEKEEESDGKEG